MSKKSIRRAKFEEDEASADSMELCLQPPQAGQGPAVTQGVTSAPLGSGWQSHTRQTVKKSFLAERAEEQWKMVWGGG